MNEHWWDRTYAPPFWDVEEVPTKPPEDASIEVPDVNAAKAVVTEMIESLAKALKTVRVMTVEEYERLTTENEALREAAVVGRAIEAALPKDLSRYDSIEIVLLTDGTYAVGINRPRHLDGRGATITDALRQAGLLSKDENK